MCYSLANALTQFSPCYSDSPFHDLTCGHRVRTPYPEGCGKNCKLPAARNPPYLCPDCVKFELSKPHYSVERGEAVDVEQRLRSFADDWVKLLHRRGHRLCSAVSKDDDPLLAFFEDSPDAHGEKMAVEADKMNPNPNRPLKRPGRNARLPSLSGPNMSVPYSMGSNYRWKPYNIPLALEVRNGRMQPQNSLPRLSSKPSSPDTKMMESNETDSDTDPTPSRMAKTRTRYTRNVDMIELCHSDDTESDFGVPLPRRSNTKSRLKSATDKKKIKTADQTIPSDRVKVTRTAKEGTDKMVEDSFAGRTKNKLELTLESGQWSKPDLTTARPPIALDDFADHLSDTRVGWREEDAITKAVREALKALALEESGETFPQE